MYELDQFQELALQEQSSSSRVNAMCALLELHLALIGCTVTSEGVSQFLFRWHRLQEQGNEKHLKSATFCSFETGSLCYATLAVLG